MSADKKLVVLADYFFFFLRKNKNIKQDREATTAIIIDVLSMVFI